MVASKSDALRKDRDRLVGFAFANADLLLELDIVLLASALRGLKRDERRREIA